MYLCVFFYPLVSLFICRLFFFYNHFGIGKCKVEFHILFLNKFIASILFTLKYVIYVVWFHEVNLSRETIQDFSLNSASIC